MDEKVLPIVEAYIEKFGEPLPIDFELRLKNADDLDEWIRVIQKAIDDNKPFEPEGVFSE